jgi:hypothetical protein
LRGRFEGLEAGLAGLFLLLLVAVAHVVDDLGEGVVILFSFALLLGVAVGEFLVGAGVALGAGEVLVVEVVEFVVDSEAAELVEDGVEAGLEAVVEGLDAGEGSGLFLGEVLGPDGGGGVAFMVEAGVGGEVGGVGLGGGRAIFGERGVKEAVFDTGEVLKFPDDEGEVIDQDFLCSGGGAVFVAEFLLEEGVGELGGGVGDGEAGGGRGGGQAVGSGVLGRAGFAGGGAWAGGFLGVLAVSACAVGGQVFVGCGREGAGG